MHPPKEESSFETDNDELQRKHWHVETIEAYKAITKKNDGSSHHETV